ncbi:uncharacterized protein [Polyergus mexicanus]|uniref:uncharacterized protein n=1 Tax=Polyergus mexicanus TaxID=615972 RepID=UPI0038B67B34
MNTNGENAINKLAIKIPPFWNEEPELWFAQLEGQFILSGITQDTTKYSYVLSQLESRQIREVKDIITHPPEANKYEVIKRALVQRLSVSQEQRIRQLLELEEIGDRKPSQFLRHLRTLAADNVPDSLLRTLWLGRLPHQTQMILATRTEDCLNDVAEQADRIHEMTSRTVVAATTTPRETLEAQIQALSKKVTTLMTHLSRGRSRDKKHDRKVSRTRSQSREFNKKNCFYHNRFGDKAQKCTPPCAFQSEKEQGSH